jgi:cytochrome o ubiquinol oxidase operon protein cyoD
MIKDSHTKSYITGFLLSLVFTAIPYGLIVTHSVGGNLLLGTILVFAVLQMLVQITFFLHLGRNPKMRWQIGFFAATIFAVLVVVLGSITIISHLHANMAPLNVLDKIATDEAVHAVGGKQVGTCPDGAGAMRMVELRNNTITPKHTDAKLCDTLMIMNFDSQSRDIEFGAPRTSETYAGQSGKTIPSGQNFAVTLTELGNHSFHDQLPANIDGDFTVAP